MNWTVLAFVLSTALCSGRANQNSLSSCDIFPWESPSWKGTEAPGSDLASPQELCEESFVTLYNGNITLLSAPWYY